MNLSKLKEPFPADCIEWRIQQAGKKQDGSPWARVIPYISARAAQDRLDDVFGCLGWQVSYSFEADGVVGCISVWDSINKHWIQKSDGAEKTDIESFKGGISGAFKRAASAWGIGRYMYDLEAGYAKIVDKNEKGAIYANSKIKNNGKEEQMQFYWIPPLLPSWALPSKGITPPESKL